MTLLVMLLAACGAPKVSPDDDADGFLASEDCDDGDASVHPGADETCDGVDEDCDGETDEEPVDPVTAYVDGDGDGVGSDTPVEGCYDLADLPAGVAASGGDCDDGDATVHPDADESCDGIDNDCSGAADDGAIDASTWYPDVDGDGFGTDEDTTVACDAPQGTAGVSGDCDDDDAEVHPGAAERCNDVDDDCDGEVGEDGTLLATWYWDADGDGDGNPAVATEACEPEDGWVANADDCDDLDADRHPGAEEQCDGVDQDCDTVIDEDAVDATAWYADADADGAGDAAGAPSWACDAPAGAVASHDDCDDADGTVGPTAAERCGGGDEDCDGSVDEADAVDALVWYVDADGDGYGDAPVSACTVPSGAVAVDGDCDDADATVSPVAVEVCDDGIDQTCDGEVDEGCFPTGGFYAGDADVMLEYTGSNEEQAGLSVAASGDLDADGHPDIVVAGIDGLWVGRADEAGTIVLEAGASISGTTSAPDLVAAFDGDGDGDEDLLVESGDGAWLYFAGPLSGTIAASAEDARLSGTENLYDAVAADFDGDGRDELAFGEIGADAGDGNVYILDGAPSADTTVDRTYDHVISGTNSNGQYMGWTLAAGDVDGDGSADLLASLYGEANRVVFVYGPFTADRDLSADAADNIVAGRAADARTGEAMAFLPDHDGDGYGDFLVAAPDIAVGSTTCAGEVYLLSGADVTAISSFDDATATIEGYDTYQYLGRSVDGADVDGDGATDLLIGAYYGVYQIFVGAIHGTVDYTSATTMPWCADDVCSFTGAPMVGAGDLFGTGQEAVAIGTPYADHVGDGDWHGGAVVIWGGSL